MGGRIRWASMSWQNQGALLMVAVAMVCAAVMVVWPAGRTGAFGVLVAALLWPTLQTARPMWARRTTAGRVDWWDRGVALLQCAGWLVLVAELFNPDTVIVYLPYVGAGVGLFLAAWLTHQGRELKTEHRALKARLAAIYAPAPDADTSDQTS